MYIDAHIHADVRSYEDFGRMALAGIEKAVTCAHDVYRMSTSDVYFDHYDRLLRAETQKAGKNGVELFVALGVHPRAIPKDASKIIRELPKFLDNKKVVAIGETGLDRVDKREVEMLKKQMEVCVKTDLPIIVHTPTKGKSGAIDEILHLVETTGVDPRKVVIDHVNGEVVEKVIDRETYIGLSIQPPSKLSHLEVAKIIEDYGASKFMLNSDMSSIASDPLAIPRTALEMKKMGISKGRIRKVSYDHASAFFDIQ